jgi:hypothetical protein
MQSHLVVPKIVLSVDRAYTPHDGGCHESEETRNQPHILAGDWCFVGAKGGGICFSVRRKSIHCWHNKQLLEEQNRKRK